jgi:hypothetical protein
MIEQITKIMTLGEFREITRDESDSLPIIIQIDAEGNGYRPARGVELALYAAQTPCEGDVYETGEGPRNATECLVVFPTC